jgi:hypothetical protein
MPVQSRPSGPTVGRSGDLLFLLVLAYDLEAIALGDDVFDLGNRVARKDCEEHGVGADLFVLRLRERDRRGAVGVSAFADEVDHVETGAFADFFDTLVDFAEESLVAGRRVLAASLRSSAVNRRLP